MRSTDVFDKHNTDLDYTVKTIKEKDRGANVNSDSIQDQLAHSREILHSGCAC